MKNRRTYIIIVLFEIVILSAIIVLPRLTKRTEYHFSETELQNNKTPYVKLKKDILSLLCSNKRITKDRFQISSNSFGCLSYLVPAGFRGEVKVYVPESKKWILGDIISLMTIMFWEYSLYVC